MIVRFRKPENFEFLDCAEKSSFAACKSRGKFDFRAMRATPKQYTMPPLPEELMIPDAIVIVVPSTFTPPSVLVVAAGRLSRAFAFREELAPYGWQHDGRSAKTLTSSSEVGPTLAL